MAAELKQVNYRLDAELADHFDRHCEQRGRVRRKAVDEALREWLARQDDPAPLPAVDTRPVDVGGGAAR